MTAGADLDLSDLEAQHAPPSAWAYEEAGERDTEKNAAVRALCAELRALRKVSQAAQRLMNLMPPSERPRPSTWSERIALRRALSEAGLEVRG